MTDWKRLKELHDERPSQMGDTITVERIAAGSVQTSQQPLRWLSEGQWDVTAWRVYLGPWQPRPNIQNVDPAILTDNYARPTPWLAPPFSYESIFDFNLYGKITFGTHGARHTAWVDWPRRGGVVQVCGDNIQLECDGGTPNDIGAVDLNLPILSASIAPEPGGGDAATPATFTYPLQGQRAPNDGWWFQIPPFARSFQLIHPVDPPNPGTLQVNVLSKKGVTGRFAGSWLIANIDRQAPVTFPIAGYAGIVHVFEDEGIIDEVGCIFHLDL